MKNKHLDISGQAVVEGVMIRNKGKYAMALRKGNSDIEIIHNVFKGIMGRGAFSKIPVLRGIFALIDSMIIGIKTFLFSSDYHEDNGKEEPQAFERFMTKIFKKYHEGFEMALVITLTLALSIGGFIVLPYYVTGILADKLIPKFGVMMLVEAIIRVMMLLLYIIVFSMKKDVKRLYAYHGAQHKVINCLRKGDELTIKNVRKCPRYDKECEGNFIFSVVFISIVLFSFIRHDDLWLQMAIRVLIVPVVAAIIYEIMLIVNKMNNGFGEFLQFPQKWLQKICTKEPTEDIMEVAIESVTAIFDWRDYLGLEPEDDVQEVDYSTYNYDDAVSISGEYIAQPSNVSMMYEENMSQSFVKNNEDIGYDDIDKDYYEQEAYNYNVPSYDMSQYDYSEQYFVESDGRENSAYIAVGDNEITKQPGMNHEVTKQPGMQEVTYNGYDVNPQMSMQYDVNPELSMQYDNAYYPQNDFNNQNYNSYNNTNNYGNYNDGYNDYNDSYGYDGQGMMQNQNYYEENEDLSSLDRYFNDDNY